MLTKEMCDVPRRRHIQVAILALSTVAVISIFAQSAWAQQTMDYWSGVSVLDRKVSMLESQNLDGRLRVVESDMFEVKWLTRTVTATLIGQFIIAGISLRRKQ